MTKVQRCTHPSAEKTIRPPRLCSGRIASIIAVDVPDVLLLARNLDPACEIETGELHRACTFGPPRRCMHSAAMRRYSSQAEEHQKHTGARIECIRSGRHARTRARLRTAPS